MAKILIASGRNSLVSALKTARDEDCAVTILCGTLTIELNQVEGVRPSYWYDCIMNARRKALTSLAKRVSNQPKQLFKV